MRASAVIVAAGRGSRMGRPKEFLPLAGRPMLEWSLKAFRKVREIREVAVVLNAEDLRRHGRELRRSLTCAGNGVPLRLVRGGKTRLESVRKGLGALRLGSQLVAVHDGARPLVTPELIRACLRKALRSGAAVCAAPAKDTLKRVEGGAVLETPPRSEFWQAQTPQCYRRSVLSRALTRFRGVGDATDESQLVERLGAKVRVVESSHANLKVTYPEDLTVADALLRRRLGPASENERSVPGIKVGMGFDVHRLVEGRRLVLGGVRIPFGKGLLGHSDGDVLLHAVADALLGALGAGEIGAYFPSSDPKHKGISSRVILKRVLGLLSSRGGRIVHLDATLVAEAPRLTPHYPKLRRSLAGLLGIRGEALNLKSKTKDGTGEVGRGEAMECYAVATLSVP